MQVLPVVPITSSMVGANADSSVAYSCHDALVLFSQEQLLSCALPFIGLDTFGSYWSLIL